jgi:hypothetical protein
MRGRLRHVLALLLFAAATVLWMWPFVAAPAAVIPGDGAGDNFLFVWNYWWARHSLLAGASPLWCPALFVPFGVDLTLDTHTLLPTTIAGLFVQDALAGTNAIIGVHLFLNFATAYALAWWMTRDWPSSLLASVILGCAPYVGERLLGHFNLIAVWVFPLVGLLTLRAFDGTRRDSVLLGIAMAAVAYLEYYYVVYAAVMVATFVAARVVRLETRAVTGAWQRRTVGALAVLVIASSAVGALVRLTGGTVLHIGGAPISLRSAGNPLAAAWLLGLTALIVALAPRMRPRLDRAALAASGRQIGTAAGVAIILTLPLLAAGARVWMNGDYVSQHYLWRSAPKGIDVATMLAGNPRGVLWHDGPADLYRRWNVDTIEQTAWMPPAVVCLCVIALWLRRRDRSLRLWLWAAAVFLIWALGPYVVAFGRTLPLPLPGILVRYVPLIANARVPSRAIAVVYAASAVFAAAGLAALRERGRRGWALALSALAIVDLLPSTPPVLRTAPCASCQWDCATASARSDDSIRWCSGIRPCTADR